MANTSGVNPLRPVPSADQFVPFHLAMLLTTIPLTAVNWPPAKKFAALSTPMAITNEPTPAPNADQLLPFQTATRFAGEPPAVVKLPPTYKFPIRSNSIACTVLPTPLPTP